MKVTVRKTFAYILLFSMLLSLYPLPVNAQTSPWISGWNYRKSIAILGSSGAGTNYQMGVKVYYGTGSDGTESYGIFTQIGRAHV